MGIATSVVLFDRIEKAHPRILDKFRERRLLVQPGEPYKQVEHKVRAAIADYFKFTLGRSEILNRIGDDIVVFDFIQPAVAGRIFTGMLDNIAARQVAEEHALALRLSEPARRQLLDWCARDLSNSGRGIGNRLATTFVYPLARALFHLPATTTATLLNGIKVSGTGRGYR